jgi:hypothetical protein
MIWHTVDGYAVKIARGPFKDFRARLRLSATQTLGLLGRNPLVREGDHQAITEQKRGRLCTTCAGHGLVDIQSGPYERECPDCQGSGRINAALSDSSEERMVENIQETQ